MLRLRLVRQTLHGPHRRWRSSLPKFLAPKQYVSPYIHMTLDRNRMFQLRRYLFSSWETLGASGRFYLSRRRINGHVILPQLSVSISRNIVFRRLLQSTNADEPFSKLAVRFLKQFNCKGFKRGALNLQDAGHELSPEQWHRKLESRNDEQNSEVLVLDARNFYEHEIGCFDGATRVMVDTFRDTFGALDEILENHEQEHDGRKPKEVMTYCTGGIRCEKVAAYLTQYKGISNVQKLHGGIVNYMRYLTEQRQYARARSVTDDGGSAINEEMSLFKGKNFVFDQRCVSDLTASEQVTDDVLGHCFQCGEPCNQHTNCSNRMCHGLILQCQSCAQRYLAHVHLDSCSDACKQEDVRMMAMAIQQQKKYRQQQAQCIRYSQHPSTSKYVYKRPRVSLGRDFSARRFSTSRAVHKHIDESELQQTYVYGQSSGLADDALLRDLREETAREWPKAEQLIDEMQGKFLSFLIQTTKAQRALEIGCFTGYSALCLASGLASDGVLITCDVDADCVQFAQRFFNKSSHAAQITAVNQDGLEVLHSLALSTRADQQPFDLIFVDANKRKYRAYYDFILEHNLLHSSGLLAFDNTLFRGRVAACASGAANNKERIARSLVDFNSYVLRDPRTTQVVMPLWDGLTLIRLSRKEPEVAK